MTQAQPTSPGELSPQPLMQMTFAHVPARVLAAGVQLDVFSALASGPRTAGQVAQAVGASERGIAMLLDALVTLELLTKSAATYSLSPLAARFLVRGRPDYAGAILEDDSLWQPWDRLVEAIRDGKPPRRLERKEEAERFFPALVRTLHVQNRAPAARLAQLLVAAHPRARTLDVACGSGVWGLAVAAADAQARVTLHDYPGVLELTREYAHRESVAEQCDYLAGDLKHVEFGEERYDVAILGNIVHSEGERSSRDLLRRMHRALKPGGHLAIVEIIPNEDRTGPPFPLFFALTMLLNTDEGNTYTLTEMRAWLLEAGFARADTADIGQTSPVVLAGKGT